MGPRPNSPRISIAHRARTLIIAPTLALAVAACAGQTIPASEPTATSVERPPIPEGWVTVASEDGTVVIVVPPDLVGIPLPGEVLVQGPNTGNVTPVEIWATGPIGAQPQPRGGEALRGWLEAGGWLPRAGSGGVTETVDEAEGEVSLPAGLAYRVAATAQPGTPEASRVIAYAVATERGFAVLRILGDPETLDTRADELALVPLLVRFPAP